MRDRVGKTLCCVILILQGLSIVRLLYKVVQKRDKSNNLNTFFIYMHLLIYLVTFFVHNRGVENIAGGS